MLRFLLLRFLPRRVLPLVTLYEAYRLYRRLQRSRHVHPPRRLVTSGPSGSAPVTEKTPPTIDGQLHGG